MPETTIAVDLRALADRPPPTAKITDPWGEADPGSDSARAAALERAERGHTAYATHTAARAANMLARALLGSHRVVFDLAEETGDIRASLVTIRDAAGDLLWYDADSDFFDNPDAVRRCEIEAHGGPVLPVLDMDTREAIEGLLATTDRWRRDWFAWTEETTWPDERDGKPIQMRYDGDLRQLIVPEALTAATALASDPDAGPRAFAAEVAALLMDGEDRDGEPFELENDDAVDTLHRLITQARELCAPTHR